MPFLRVVTNVEMGTAAKAEFIKEASQCMSQLLGKPEKFVMVELSNTSTLSMGGDHTSPCCLAEIKSIGKLGVAENKIISKGLCDLLHRTLHIESDRYYCFFSDYPRHEVGWSGTTFAN